MARYSISKSPLVPVGSTPAIPKPWNLYDQYKGRLVSCHATREEAEAARIDARHMDEARRQFAEAES
jgi:hypothetical protein